MILRVLSLSLVLCSQASYAELLEEMEDLEEVAPAREKPQQVEPAVEELPVRRVKKPHPVPEPAKDTKTNRGDAKPSKKNPLPGDKRVSSKEPIRLKSEGTSRILEKGNLIKLEKNVVITQKDLRLQADYAEVRLQEVDSKREVTVVTVRGNVKMSKYSENPDETVTAFGDRGFFYNTEQKVRLVGNARLWRGDHLVRGNEIVYLIETGVITVDQAQGVVHPQ